MTKIAQTNAHVIDAVAHRWSPRAFTDKSVKAVDLKSILEAARWAASAYNEQPWRYIVATRDNEAEFNKLLGVLVEANQAWAKGAQVLMLSLAKKTYTYNGSNNRHAWHDVGMADAQLSLQASALGIATHWMAGFDGEKARDVYNIPDEFEPVAALAIGYEGDPETLPEGYRKAEVAPRERKTHDQLFFTGSFGQPTKL
ncbi:MAG: nitroreductase [Proteobacteria bacterium]|nr:nitroreductase [Pseudomonadota bacterium]